MILLAVGLVFSVGAERPRDATLVVAQETASTEDEQPDATAAATATGAPDEPATPESTATPATPEVVAEAVEETATPTSVPPLCSVATRTPTGTPTASPEPTATAPATATPVPVVQEPTATPTPRMPPPTRLVAPAINLDTVVIEVGWQEEVVQGTRIAVWDVADFAAGWHKTAARPGEPGNIVISGHHNIKGEVFRYIVDLQPEAQIFVYAGDAVHEYRVIETQILPEKGQPLEVRRRNAEYIGVTDHEVLTLVTCWPYNNNTHRVIVRAKPVR